MADNGSDKPAETPQSKMAPPPSEEVPTTKDAAAMAAVGEEREIWTGSVNPRFFSGQWIVLILISILLLVGGIMLRTPVGASWPLWAALVLIAIGWLVMIGKVVYFKMARKYRLTNKRLFIEEGILVRTANQTDLIRVNDVSVTQKILDRIFNVGTVIVDAPTDTSHPKILIFGIEDPHTVAEHIHREMRLIRDKRALMMEAT